MLAVVTVTDVSCSSSISGDGILLSTTLGEVGEVARSNIESGDAGSNGEASLKKVVMRRGAEDMKEELRGDDVDTTEAIEAVKSGEYGM